MNKLLGMLIFLTPFLAIKGDPGPFPDKAIALKRAKSLDNGISISWLEQTWNGDVLYKNVIKNKDLELLKHLGFKGIRLPVAFNYYQVNSNSHKKVLNYIDETLQLCKLHGLKLTICYHTGNLNDQNYLTETPKIINIWARLAKRYIKESPDDLFFELYNEPPHMDPQVWHDAAYNVITAIRKIDKTRTLIVGASNYNSIYELSRSTPMGDDNIIYTFHFYEPFFFTHQGADWIGDQVATTGVPFPYDANNYPALNPKARGTAGEANYNKYNLDGNVRSVQDKLNIVKSWSVKYGVPILCGEYGVYNKYADLDSRCRYIKAVRQTLKTLNIPGMLWDYNSNFSIFEGEPNIKNLPVCMQDAIGFNARK